MALFGSTAANADFEQMTGDSTGSTATAGNIGEYIATLVAVASAISLPNTTPTTVAGISLTAGDWDVQGQVSINYVSATQNGDAKANIFTGAATTIALDGTEGYDNTRLTTTTCNKTITFARRRISLASTTTINLNAAALFSAGSANGFGFISARRVR